MKNKIKEIISAILLCTVLAGCSNSAADSHIISSGVSNCPISTLRTGTQRQGIKTYGNGFECTETGSYFMSQYLTHGAAMLLYVDHGSDNIIKLCGRPDCDHTGKECNAFFESTSSICYYEGFLYTYDEENDEIIRMNLDGTERMSVYSLSSFAAKGGYNGHFGEKIFNGILIVEFMKVDEDGNQLIDGYYYKLDGSMDEPKPMSLAFNMKADGESFVGPVDYDKETGIFTYGIWNPDKGVIAELFKDDNLEAHVRGYIGTEAEYYVENGVIIEDSYTEGKKELLDTGLEGNYQLVCFPDCVVMYQYISDEESTQNASLDEVTLYFYDWDFNNIGSVKINYEFQKAILQAGLICGETPERIILTDYIDCVPRYYINKSDFGTGNIEIHPFKLPDGLESEFMEGNELEENN